MGGLFTAILFSLVGVAYLWTGVTARKGLKMTSFYAVRTEHTRKTPEIFAAANRAVWGLFIVNGAIAVIACGLVLVFKAYRVEGFANTFVAIAVIAGVFTVSAVQVTIANRVAKRLAAEQDDADKNDADKNDADKNSAHKNDAKTAADDAQ